VSEAKRIRSLLLLSKLTVFRSYSARRIASDSAEYRCCQSEDWMVSKSANPACRISFRCFRGGKLYLVEPQPAIPLVVLSIPAQLHVHRRHSEYFWLCEQCAKNLTLTFDEKGTRRSQAAIKTNPGYIADINLPFSNQTGLNTGQPVQRKLLILAVARSTVGINHCWGKDLRRSRVLKSVFFRRPNRFWYAGG
jgi:hypothetical protein